MPSTLCSINAALAPKESTAWHPKPQVSKSACMRVVGCANPKVTQYLGVLVNQLPQQIRCAFYGQAIHDVPVLANDLLRQTHRQAGKRANRYDVLQHINAHATALDTIATGGWGEALIADVAYRESVRRSHARNARMQSRSLRFGRNELPQRNRHRALGARSQMPLRKKEPPAAPQSRAGRSRAATHLCPRERAHGALASHAPHDRGRNQLPAVVGPALCRPGPRLPANPERDEISAFSTPCRVHLTGAPGAPTSVK